MRLCALALAALTVTGCPASVAPVVPARKAVRREPPPPTEADLVRAKADALSKDAEALSRAVDEALWAHWTRGAPLDLAKAAAGHQALLSKEALATLRRAEDLGAGDARRLQILETWLLGELLARALAEDSATVANLEATATVAVDGKEQTWRELNRLLLSEKSAVKRRALWAASLKAAARVDAALAHRDEAARAFLASLDAPGALELAADARDLDLDALQRAADELLLRTDRRWQATLEALTAAELKLPVDKLVRADLPRLLRAPADVDAAFPKDKAAPCAVQTLSGLGFYGRAGLTLDLAEAANKNPLPLTVAPGGPADVRLSFRPLGGLRDQTLLLSELGTALALRGAATGQFETSRLGDPGTTELTGELFATLIADRAWLEEAGVAPAAVEKVVATARAQRLASLRRAAGTVLARLETAELPELDARERYVAVMSRALGVKPALEDGVRWRVDTDDFLRSATLLRSALLAEVVRARLVEAYGAAWWKRAEAGQALAALWAGGTSAPLEARVAPMAGALEPLLAALGVEPGAAPTADTDGGVAVRAWPRPGAAEDGGVMARAWPRPRQIAPVTPWSAGGADGG